MRCVALEPHSGSIASLEGMALTNFPMSYSRQPHVPLQPSTKYIDIGRRAVIKVEYKREASEILDLHPPVRSLARAESHALESEVLTYQHLREAGLPVPTVLRVARNSSSNKVMAASICRPEGVPLASACWASSDGRHAQVQRQLERAKQSLAAVRGSSFGPIAVVADGKGAKSWSGAFAAMFEALLQDGEDHFVNLPYTDIRRLIAMSKGELEAITEAQLVIPRLGKDEQVWVDRETGKITSFVGGRDAFWGDAEVWEERTGVLVYRCYRAVRTVVVNHVRPTPGCEKVMMAAREEVTTVLRARLT